MLDSKTGVSFNSFIVIGGVKGLSSIVSAGIIDFLNFGELI